MINFLTVFFYSLEAPNVGPPNIRHAQSNPMVSGSSCRSSLWCPEVGWWGFLDYTHSSPSPRQRGGVEAQGHTRVMLELIPARPRLVITLWSPGGSGTACPRPCGGAWGWTWLTLCGRCAPSRAPRQHSAPPESEPGPAGRPLAGCWGQRSGGCLCCRGPRALLRDPSAPLGACAWSAVCHGPPPMPRHSSSSSSRSLWISCGGRRGRINSGTESKYPGFWMLRFWALANSVIWSLGHSTIEPDIAVEHDFRQQ